MTHEEREVFTSLHAAHLRAWAPGYATDGKIRPMQPSVQRKFYDWRIAWWTAVLDHFQPDEVHSATPWWIWRTR